VFLGLPAPHTGVCSGRVSTPLRGKVGVKLDGGLLEGLRREKDERRVNDEDGRFCYEVKELMRRSSALHAHKELARSPRMSVAK